MKIIHSMVTAGVLALLVGGGVALPVQDAEAYTRCRDVYTRGVHKRICTTTTRRSDYRDDRRWDNRRDRGDRRWEGRRYNDRRMVCRTYWRDGERHRTCRPARGARR